MSEELLQIAPHHLGRYLYYRLGASTLAQLAKHKIIGTAFPKQLATKKPDGLVVLPGGVVKAVVEYKQASELKTARLRTKAIGQEMEVARSLAKLLIVSDGTQSFWINALSGKPILDAEGREVRRQFDVGGLANGTVSHEEIFEIERLIDMASHSLTDTNDVLEEPRLLDPTPLAKSIWQRIWINTGKEPEKCLYNVVELFVFKFLSDIGVLKAHNNFTSVVALKESASSLDALKHYADRCRKDVRTLFPKGDDGTTIINGTIFVNENGDPNTSQAALFGEVIGFLEEFDETHGSFRYIDREFKTRLYEAFLRQGAGVKALGQFFTPRNVVRAMVRMSIASTLRSGSRICDPFCGVGGFVLEAIVESPAIYKQFTPRNGVVAPNITVLGFDKGSDEKEDERTIILAKANMLIYFSDLLAKYHTPEYLQAFSKGAFNAVFHLLRSNLGTFAKFDQQPFDLILTNPPYVTSGSSSLKRAIADQGLGAHYPTDGRGTEALAIDWIVGHLRDEGQAVLVVPDGLLMQRAMLKSILDRTTVEAIISLPVRTFYSTTRKTYILIFSRKQDASLQDAPVFSYLVSEIGETRDADRLPLATNHLDEAATLFLQFRAAKSTFQTTSARCKVIPSSDLATAKHWMVDRRWTSQEKAEMGIVDSETEMSKSDFAQYLRDLQELANGCVQLVDEDAVPAETLSAVEFESIYLSDVTHFRFINNKTGWTRAKWTKLNTEKTDDIPLYTAAREPVAFVDKNTYEGKSISATSQSPVISFGANGEGSAGTNFVFHTRPFLVSNDRTCIAVVSDRLVPKYVYHRLHNMKRDYGFGFRYKANQNNAGSVEIPVPIRDDKTFDVDYQQEYVVKTDLIQYRREAILTQLRRLDSAELRLD